MSSASWTNSNNKKLVYGITSSDNSTWMCSCSKYYGNGIRPVYCDSRYMPKSDFIRPDIRTYTGRALVISISGCWDIPYYSKNSSTDSGDIIIKVKFDKEGNVIDFSMDGLGPVSKNEDTLNAIEKEIRSKKMKSSFSRNTPILNESDANICYEFR